MLDEFERSVPSITAQMPSFMQSADDVMRRNFICAYPDVEFIKRKEITLMSCNLDPRNVLHHLVINVCIAKVRKIIGNAFNLSRSGSLYLSESI
jgi:hypothetical protein